MKHFFTVLCSLFILCLFSGCDTYYSNLPYQQKPGYALNKPPRFGYGAVASGGDNQRPLPPRSGSDEKYTPVPGSDSGEPPPPRRIKRTNSAEDWKPAPNPLGSDETAPLPPSSSPPPPSTPPAVSEIPFARAVPDKPGFVYSPYDGKELDVTGLKSGSKAKDPDSGKVFRVP